jgi:clan AA aspartic protease
MITGAVKSGEARIRVKVRGRQGREQELEAIVDTGYSGALTLPPALIRIMGLRWKSTERAILADGSTCVFQVYEATLAWNGKWRAILVGEADVNPLLGMRLLRGHELRVQVRARGKVTIKPLHSK